MIKLPDILHHSQQDLKNRVSQPKIKGLTISHSQETRFFTQVQDVSYLIHQLLHSACRLAYFCSFLFLE